MTSLKRSQINFVNNKIEKRTYCSQLIVIFATEIKNDKIMEELREKANSYAEENVNNVLKEAFAKVYADGYRDGYKDCDENNAIDLQDGETEFVDLGLPSGTLWSSDYEIGDSGYKYLPYDLACMYSIPSMEQLEELFKICKFETKRNSSNDIIEVYCIGPNGNIISFKTTGYIKVDEIESAKYISKFWLNEEIEGSEKCIGCFSWNKMIYKSEEYSGYKLPVRLVKAK